MKYKVIYEIIVLLFFILYSGYLIYSGIRQIKRVPFINRGFSSRAGRVLRGIIIFSSFAINEESHMIFSVTALFLLILFFIFSYIDYKKFCQLYIYNIDQETLEGLIEEYSEEKDLKFEIIDSPTLVDSLYNEVRIYKSKSTKNIRNIIRDFEMHISQRKYKKFRVMGLVNILFGVGLLIFVIHIYIKFHI